MAGWFRQDMNLAAMILDDLGLEIVVKADKKARPGDACVLAPSEVNPSAGFYRMYVVGWTRMAADEQERAREEAEAEAEEGEGDGEGEEEGKENGADSDDAWQQAPAAAASVS